MSFEDGGAPAPAETTHVESTPAAAPETSAVERADRPTYQSPREAYNALRKEREEQGGAPQGEAAPVAFDDGSAGEHPTTHDAPKSWSDAGKEHFKSLPPETQKLVAEIEKNREDQLGATTKQHDEYQKALEAYAQQAYQIKSQYEQALPQVMSQLQQHQTDQFGDIKSWDDVQTLARDNWPRYVQWDAHQKKVTAVQAQYSQAQERAQQEQKRYWDQWSTQQDNALNERAPQLKDPKKAVELQSKVRSDLQRRGYSQDEMISLWSTNPIFRDVRMQEIILEATLYRDAKAQLEKAQAKPPVPPVLKPGNSPQRAAPGEGRIKELSALLEKTGSMKVAQELRAAELSQRRRRAAS